MKVHAKMTVGELTTDFPSALDILIKRRLLCVGCPAQEFHTIEDVARIYGIGLESLLAELRNTVHDGDWPGSDQAIPSRQDVNADAE